MLRLLMALCVFATALPPRCLSLDLIDDQQYQEDARKAEVEAAGNDLLLLEVAGKYMAARDYVKAAAIYSRIIATYPINQSLIYSNQSVFLGKLKDYPGALAMADQALALDPKSVHARMVKASWLWESGKHEEAMALYGSVRVPANGSFADESLYYSCKACFFASVGNQDELASAITACIALHDDRSIVFFKRDIVFDPYRTEDWFVALVGVTVK